jgi:hypothetical protein
MLFSNVACRVAKKLPQICHKGGKNRLKEIPELLIAKDMAA